MDLKEIINTRIIINNRVNQHASKIEWWYKNNLPIDEVFRLTSFLPNDVKISERIICVLNDIKERPKCECGSLVKFDTSLRSYRQFCSPKCTSSSYIVRQKIEKTCLNRYGEKTNITTKEFKEKSIKTNLERYGVTNAMKSDIIKNKQSKTMFDRYGERVNRKEITKTMQERYGCNHPYENPGILKKAQQTVREKFPNGVFSCPNIRSKTKKTLQERYGVDNIAKITSGAHIPDDVKEKLNNKKWLECEHNKGKSLVAFADELDISPSYMGTVFRRHGIEIKIFGGTSFTEDQLSQFVSSLGFTVTRNDRNLIKPLELDIVIEEKKIAIEYCGLYWHSNVYRDSNYHLDKLNQCNQSGYRLITIFEDEWIHKQDIVKSKLKSILGKDDREKIFARKCSIGEVDSKTAKEFFESNHIQGNGNDSIRLGLYSKDELVACLSFKNKGEGVYDLNRYATSKNVIGGFSKLLTYFKRNFDWKEIITFADRRWSEGNLYLKSGFEHKHDTLPNYFYIVKGIRESRIKYQKHKLSKIVTNFDPTLTEIQNTEANGLLRIYDCGNMKFSQTIVSY